VHAREYAKGDLVTAPDHDGALIVRAIRTWPFEYAECVTTDRLLVAIPTSRLMKLSSLWFAMRKEI
jgi:hypothetical protein